MKRTAISLVLLATALSAPAQLFPAKPDVTYVADTAHVLSPQDSATITKESKALLKATGAPIVVVTVRSLSSVDAQSLGVEKYAQKMFDTWHIGSKNNNRGILIVLAKDDHKARIEFGKSWAHKYDGPAKTIMQSTMTPYFRSGKYSQGLTRGVQALTALAKGIKSGQLSHVTQTTSPVYIDQTSNGSMPVTYEGGASPFSFPTNSEGFSITWLLAPLGFMLFPLLVVIGMIIAAIKRGNSGSGTSSYWNKPNNTYNDPFSNTHHHHHHDNFGSSNSSSSSDSSSSSSSGSSDSGGSSGGGGSTGSW